MAFSEAQRVKIRKYLGFPDTFQQNNTRLESAMNVIGSRPDTQAAVEAVLTDLATAETQVAASFTTAGLKRAEDVEWYEGGTEIRSKLGLGRMHAARLSIIMGVPLVGDYFGTSGYQGDNWMGPMNQYGFPIALG